jgi:starch phosphorylase
MPVRGMIMVEGREVYIRAWRYFVLGVSGNTVPIYFLDTKLPENSPGDQKITDHLYGGDDRYRICQNVISATLSAPACPFIPEYP